VSVLGRLVGVSLVPPLRRRVRLPRRRPAVAWAIAVVGPVLITVGSRPFQSTFAPATILFCTLLVVVAVGVIGGVRPALAAVAAGVLSQEIFISWPYGSLNDQNPAQAVVLVAFVVVGGAVGILVDELTRLGEEEAAFRRVATLVARGAPPDEVFAAVTEEVGQLFPVDHTNMSRYESDGTVAVLAGWRATGEPVEVGARYALEGENLSTFVARTSRPARIDYAEASGPIAVAVRQAGFRSGVATPIVVEGRLWGLMTAASRTERSLPSGTEARLADFTDLLATAIANAESRTDLAASRGRLVATADETRRRIERDLHDGAQQRLVSLALELRAAQTTVPPELGELEAQLSGVADGLASVQNELREIARGIHPAILIESGLGPALKTLSRRSPVPVELDVSNGARLPERVEVTAYYVVSEALTNAAKHADATVVHVDVHPVDGALRVSVRDDGAGGADPTAGSGLVGLRDRVEALGGRISVESPVGTGTSVRAELPLSDQGIPASR
jgi:signal transduction histidine kinase